MRPSVLVRAEAEGRGRRARPVRGGRLPRARRPGLGLPGRRPGGLRPLGGPQGPAGHRRPGRDGRGDLRAALPRGDRARQHRADLQLRRAPGPAHGLPRRLHRHGVRRRQVAEGDRQRPPHPARQARPAAGGAGLRVRPGGPGGARPSAQPQPALLRLQGRQRDPDRGPAQADRHGRGAQDGRRGVGHLRHGRVPGSGGRRGRPVGGERPLHRRPHPRRPDLRLPGVHERLRRLPAGPGQHRGVPAVRVVLPPPGPRHGPRPGPPVRLRAGDDRAADGRPAGGRLPPVGPRPARPLHTVRARAAGHGLGVVPEAER
ncbi:putative Serine/threonine-protein kinase PknG [Streptomyces afghaniensis 772]|uniref:Putative Serine/threonine-protein kinase PknG n=1 Tax=Streptomyces afghaniensis 772 TaxID=1283301 RepID=S4ML59_9ACTN|nr:putative Serine/threonine-protein kinase PknG [Streptomyces afghaniensis 772]